VFTFSRSSDLQLVHVAREGRVSRERNASGSGTIDDEIRAAVAERVDRSLDDERVKRTSFETEELEDINALMDRVPPDDAHYLKVYKKFPVPREYGTRPLFLIDIQQPATIADLEAHIMALARQNEWGDGLYEIRLFKSGESGVKRTSRISLKIPVTPIANPKTTLDPASATPNDVYLHLKNTALLLKELSTAASPGSGTSVQPEAIVRAVTDAYRAGAEALKVGTGEQKGGGVLEIVKALKEMMPPPAPVRDAKTELIGMLGLLKEMGLFGGQRQSAGDNILQTLTQLKEAGLLPGAAASAVDPTAKALELLTSLLPLMDRLSGRGGGEDNTSIGVEIVRQLMPQASSIVKDVTSTINTVVASRSGGHVSIPIPMSPSPNLPPPTLPPTESKSEPMMLPIFRPIKEAIEAQDAAYFPKLEELIVKYGESGYEELLSGQRTLDSVLEWLRPMGGEFFVSDQAKVYFMAFLEWARAKKAAVTLGKCTDCGAEFEFTSLEEFQADTTCLDCKGSLVIMTPSVVAPPSEPTTSESAE
jgi:hypothetical protein